MNTRGLMEFIVVNLGHDLGVIPESLFFMLVPMAVSTTYMTAPLIRRLIRKTELEPFFQAPGFFQEPLTARSAAPRHGSRKCGVVAWVMRTDTLPLPAARTRRRLQLSNLKGPQNRVSTFGITAGPQLITALSEGMAKPG